jgi:cell division initiation protein
MALTPVEIRHISFPGRLLGGYRRAPVDRMLTDIADSFEDVWRERADMSDHVEHLEAELTRHRELEALLRTTLVSAERTAHELKEQATREARVILNEAHAESRSITREAAAERERLDAESRRARAILRSALATLDEAGPHPVEGGTDGATAEAAAA